MHDPRAARSRPARNGIADADEAEAIAIRGLTFIASDPVLFPRFLALTGLDPQGLRRAAEERGFLPGVLEFILGHEPTLIAFCEAAELDPARVSSAWQAMAGPRE
ncbi:DUF3572 domain-containing protein [Jiella sonneratiae]|uniref:DUF3572 domain-containing protein n=1 Tax=Jiella sonneratiae TaxID=2816856 RepID=A0ABS3IXW8_9HYPH|nr:DUF3572 domain-containing protein [Jiella sonneratiae]MBO0902264.1 DUF3572 domain-containing protein [Jiella sonneratiae]